CAWERPLACAFSHLRAKVASQPLSLLVLTTLPASCAAANVFSSQRTFRASAVVTRASHFDCAQAASPSASESATSPPTTIVFRMGRPPSDQCDGRRIARHGKRKKHPRQFLRMRQPRTPCRGCTTERRSRNLRRCRRERHCPGGGARRVCARQYAGRANAVPAPSSVSRSGPVALSNQPSGPRPTSAKHTVSEGRPLAHVAPSAGVRPRGRRNQRPPHPPQPP